MADEEILLRMPTSIRNGSSVVPIGDAANYSRPAARIIATVARLVAAAIRSGNVPKSASQPETRNLVAVKPTVTV